MAPRKLFLLGLDSVSLPFIREYRAEMPALAALMEEGVLRPLASTADFLSASVWPTFASGRMPGEHGQYYPMQWDASGQRFRRNHDPAWAGRLDYEPFWYPIARAGADVIAFDVAHVMRSDEAPCLEITNWSYQSSGAATASDPAVLAEIRRRFGRRPIGPEVPVPKTSEQCEAIRRRLVAATRAKGAAIRWLMTERPWDLFLAGLYEAHRASHNLWPVDGDFASDADADAMLDIYVETDREVGRIREVLDRETLGRADLVVFALHGIEANRAQNHFLAEITARLNALWREGRVSEPTPPGRANPVGLLRKVLPPTVQYRLVEMLGESVQDWAVNRSLVDGRDWCATPAFPIECGGEGLIRLNLRGREREGCVDPADPETERFLAWLVERIEELEVAETGERLVETVALTRDIYPGPRADLLPDVLIRWKPAAPARRIRSPAIGEIEAHLATGRGGNHNDEAFAIVAGSGAARDRAGELRHIADLAGFVRALAGEWTSRTPVQA